LWLSSILFSFQLAVQHGPALLQLHEPLELLAHARYLAIQSPDVAFGPRELASRFLQTTPQVRYPEAQRCDLDHLAWVRLFVELRRTRAKCRSKGGELSRQVRVRTLPRLKLFVERTQEGVYQVSGGEVGARDLLRISS
jgi:hypothetical protein